MMFPEETGKCMRELGQGRKRDRANVRQGKVLGVARPDLVGKVWTLT